ncbi:DUF481 domain-containing protein [Wohlfahrtiimonas larvae]|uniref:DUF481 domain-containing protein n=2 Tax=Wohlfahrtiimonas larvae TaxID=1157986 RepID=A0ABP9MLW9_9GAMM
MISLVSADEVHLKNGDRLTGNIIYFEGQYLFIKTEYAGTIKVNNDKVKSFSIDNLVNIKQNLFSSSIVAKEARLKNYRADTKGQSKKVLVIQNGDGVTEIPITSELSVARINGRSPKKSPLTYSGSINLGIYVDTDSSKTSRYNFDGTLGLKYDFWRHTLKGKFYRKTENEKTKSYYYHLDYSVDRFFTQSFFWQGAMSYQHDWQEDIRANKSIGTGPGWQVWEDEHSALSLASLLNYQMLDYRDGEHSENPQIALKWDFYQYFGDRAFKLTTSGEIGRSFNRNVLLDLKANATLSYKLTESLLLNTGISYEKVRAKDGDSRNKSINLGIGYQW